jgi:hypothetical protein
MRRSVSNSDHFTRCLAVVFALLLGASRAGAGSDHTPSHATPVNARAKRSSVVDYYYMLEDVGIMDKVPLRYKRELLQPQSHPVIDLRHDYLLVHPDSSPAEQIAVFRSHGHPDLLAVSMPDYQSDYNFFALYRLQKGKLRDVTRQMLPTPALTHKRLYELPRVGTMIRVYNFDLDTQSRRYAFSLQWREGRFVKAR